MKKKYTIVFLLIMSFSCILVAGLMILSKQSANEKKVVTVSTSWMGYDFKQAAMQATTIVHGKVLDKSETIVLPVYDTVGNFAYNEYYREVTVEVLEAVKGAENVETITYLELGGETEEIVYVFEGIRILNIGEECIFFLNESGAFLNPETVLPISNGFVSPSNALVPENYTIQQAYTMSSGIKVDTFMDAIKNELE